MSASASAISTARRRSLRLTLVGVSLILAMAAAAAAEPSRDLPRLEPSRCAVEVPGAAAADCLSLVVPQDHDAPGGREVRIPVVVLHATGSDPSPDPVVFATEGGPGFPGLTTVEYFAGSALRTQRDIVIIDQRGTGASTPSLACPERDRAYEQTASAETEERELALLEALGECRARLLARGVDPQHFNSSQTVDDLEVLRKLLGRPPWNGIGGSYGASLFINYLREHPEGLRSVVLDAVTIPLSGSLSERWRTQRMLRAMEEVARTCRESEDCARAYVSLDETLQTARGRLASHPVRRSIKNWETGLEEDVILDDGTLDSILFLSLYSATNVRVLPFVLSEVSQGRTAALEALISLHGARGSNLSGLMHRTVYCREDFPFGSATVAELRARDVDSADLLERWTRTCAVLKTPPAPVSRRAPVEAGVPALVLSGQYDPVTPPAWSEAAANRLARAKHVSLPFKGHVAWHEPCGEELTAGFIENPTRPLDTSCLDDIPPPRFVTSSDIEPTDLAYRLRTSISPRRNASAQETAVTSLWLVLLLAELGLSLILLLRDRAPGRGFRIATHSTATVVAGLHFAFLSGLRGAIARSSDSYLLDYGLPRSSAYIVSLPSLMVPATVVLLALVAASWSRRSGHEASAWSAIVVAAAALAQLAWLWSWDAL